MVDQNDSRPSDPIEALSADVARIIDTVERGEKKEMNWNRLIAIVVVAIFGSGGYLASQQPKQADSQDIDTYIRANPDSIRPDKWTGTMDDARMRENSEQRRRELDHIRGLLVSRIDRKKERIAGLEERMGDLEDKYDEFLRDRAEHDASAGQWKGRINGNTREIEHLADAISGLRSKVHTHLNIPSAGR